MFYSTCYIPMCMPYQGPPCPLCMHLELKLHNLYCSVKALRSGTIEKRLFSSDKITYNINTYTYTHITTLFIFKQGVLGLILERHILDGTNPR